MFSPLAQGLLTDRYLSGDVPADSRAATSRFLSAEKISAEYLERIRGLDAIAKERGQSIAQLALSWVLREPLVASALIGASSVAQLEQNVAALDAAPLDDDEIARIEPFAATAPCSAEFGSAVALRRRRRRTGRTGSGCRWPRIRSSQTQGRLHDERSPMSAPVLAAPREAFPAAMAGLTIVAVAPVCGGSPERAARCWATSSVGTTATSTDTPHAGSSSAASARSSSASSGRPRMPPECFR